MQKAGVSKQLDTCSLNCAIDDDCNDNDPCAKKHVQITDAHHL